MAPKHHPAPLSGGDRKALKKEISKSRAMTCIFAERSEEKRREGEALIREADNLACQSWNERMWSDGGPVDPSPTIDQGINGGYPWLEIACSRCKAKRDVDLCALRHVPTTCVHDLVGGWFVRKSAGKRPAATLLQQHRACDIHRRRNDADCVIENNGSKANRKGQGRNSGKGTNAEASIKFLFQIFFIAGAECRLSP
jgi:hypothetical protein